MGSILVGTWRNEWGEGERAGNERVEITQDGKYIVNGNHVFDIYEYHYDKANREIRFLKSAASLRDYRRLLNVLKVENNQLLVGHEVNWPIRYVKIT